MTARTAIRKAFTGDHAESYDQKARQAGWLDPDIVFGLAYRYVEPGETILDIGIGTGLSSFLFHKAGLRVLGMDFSSEMLAACRRKSFAEKLVEHDAAIAPYPFADNSIHHAVCTGLMHLFGDLGPMFSETARILIRGGVFAFVAAHPNGEETQQAVCDHGGCSGKVAFHFHSPSSLDVLFERHGFQLAGALLFTSSAVGGRERTYRACVARKT